MDSPSMNHIAGGDLLTAAFPVQPIADGWMGSNSFALCWAGGVALNTGNGKTSAEAPNNVGNDKRGVMKNDDEEGNENTPDDYAFNLPLSW